ncbi:MAG: CheD [Parcubacteria group bacterium GW2011_GWA2_47_7]|nr:MAG: CheD [Parcubacteria group bacterium GW2011_GWA2_47_7]
MSSDLEVRIAEICVGNTSEIIKTNGVGSCIAIIIYDPILRIGGLAHAMLPTANGAKGVIWSNSGKGFVKYADSAVDALVSRMESLGGVRKHFVAKLVGGAHMFTLIDGDVGIGQQNTNSAKSRLGFYGIPIDAEVTGGTVGRNVQFDCATGIVEVITKV